jgi:hypothetical protein
MFCTRCGERLNEDYDLCPSCGNRVPGSEAQKSEGPETSLLTFGPFGVTVYDGPYSMFKWQRKNVTTIEVTNLRILGVPNQSLGFFKLRGRRKDCFEIPYSSIVSLEVFPHPAHLGLMDILDIKYRLGGAMQEKSICSYSNNIKRAYQLIQPLIPAQAFG